MVLSSGRLKGTPIYACVRTRLDHLYKERKNLAHNFTKVVVQTVEVAEDFHFPWSSLVECVDFMV